MRVDKTQYEQKKIKKKRKHNRILFFYIFYILFTYLKDGGVYLQTPRGISIYHDLDY